jgi:hypothetical protein
MRYTNRDVGPKPFVDGLNASAAEVLGE